MGFLVGVGLEELDLGCEDSQVCAFSGLGCGWAGVLSSGDNPLQQMILEDATQRKQKQYRVMPCRVKHSEPSFVEGAQSVA